MTSAAKNVYKNVFVGGKLRNPSTSSVVVNGHVYYGALNAKNMNFNGGKTELSTLSAPPVDFDRYEYLATHIEAGSYADGYDVIVVEEHKGACYHMYDFLAAGAQGANNGKTLVVFPFSNDICLTTTPDGRQFGPSVLAPFSKVILKNAGYIDGTVVAKTFVTGGANRGSAQQLHGNMYNG